MRPETRAILDQTSDTTHGRLCRNPISHQIGPHRVGAGERLAQRPSRPRRHVGHCTIRLSCKADLVVRSDVIRPISVLNRSGSTSRPRLELAQRLVSGPFWTDSPWSTRVSDGGTIISSTPTFPLVDGTFRGAGGNRTPVHQPVDELATTIPGIATDAVTPTGRLSARGGPRSVFPESQQSFPLAAVFPAVIPHFCCRAVMDWPRATFLLTMTLRSLDVNQAARANCSSAILVVPPFSESEELGSQTRTALLTSKPVSPMFNMCSHRICS